MRRGALIGSIVAVTTLHMGAVCRAAAQVDDVTPRGPRFLAISPKLHTPVDASNAPILRRRVSLLMRGASTKAALDEVARQAKVKFLYSDDLIRLDRKVSLDVKKLTVAAALTEILIGTGVDVLVLPDGQLGLMLKDGRGITTPGGTVVGRVGDAKTGQGVRGAEIFLAGTQWRTTADTAGRYRLANVDSGTYTLNVRRFGYAKWSQSIAIRPGREDTVDIALAPVAAKLEDLITTATGQQRRRDIGNAITTINADSVLQTAPIRNLTDLLENRVPGLTVQHTSGAPGDPAKLRLRGLGSAQRSNDPVVIVDGVRVYAVQSDARSGNLTNLVPGTRVNPVDVPAPSPLDQIDPNIIEKIEVFKGPSAATLYGADAANGVIVVTTKKGRAGPTRWNLSLARGRTTTAGRYPVGYFRWGYDLLTGIPRFCTLIDVLCGQDSLVQFQALNNSALTVLGHGGRTAISLTASGGAQALTYSITGSYSNENGLLTMPAFEVERFRVLFNEEPPEWMQRPHRLETWNVTSSVSARLGASANVTLSTAISRSEQQRTSLEQQLAALSGTYVDTVNGIYYRPSGSGNYVLNTTSTILNDYYVRQTASTITLTTGLAATWRPRSWLDMSGQAGLNVIPRSDHLLLPAGLVSTTDSGSVARGLGRSLVSTFNVQGAIHKSLGAGFVFTTNLGVNLTTTNTNDLISSAMGLVPGTSSLTGARQISAAEQGSNTSVYGWYIEPRIGGQRLSLSTGIRLDGGSAYGTKFTRTGGGFLGGLLGLPKLNGSWVISEESWFPFKAAFSSLRLRGAYGQAQVQPGPTDRLRLYSGSVDEAGSQLMLSTLGNTKLRPERSTEFEGGFDADLFDSRVSMELTAYRKLQVDALMNLALPGSVNGGGTRLTNIGNIRNSGIELTLGVTPVQLPTMSWHIQFNYSQNANLLTKIGDGVSSDKEHGLVEGYPIGSRWARPILGFADQNGDQVLQPQEIKVGDSLVYMGRLYPAHTASLQTSVSLFHAIDLDATFSYNSGATQVDQTARTNWVLVRALVDPSAALNEQAAVLASTRSDNPTDYGLMQEISTLRFNSMAVRYRLPSRVARMLHAEEGSVSIQGANLGLHSTYRGKDPDVSAWTPGENILDTGQLTQPRTWQAALSLRF